MQDDKEKGDKQNSEGKLGEKEKIYRKTSCVNDENHCTFIESVKITLTQLCACDLE